MTTLTQFNFDTDEPVVYQFRAGRYLKPIKVWREGGRFFFKFGFNRPLMNWIKSLEAAKWHGFDTPTPRKFWSVKDTSHNRFQLRYLNNENPYAHYEGDLPDIQDAGDRLPMYDYQREMVAHVIRGKWTILACEMGTGKTRVFIEAMERIGVTHDEAWYVGPKAGVTAVGRELNKWASKVRPHMMTYNGMVKAISEWQDGAPPPRFVCFDESAKLKTPSAQRSQSALYLAEKMREHWGDDCYVVLMSGSPAPKTPLDWWHQCKVACPGFIKEGTLGKFKARLCIIEMKESITGAKFPHIVSWLDDKYKCKECGEMDDSQKHNIHGHKFVASRNEVEFLYERMKGLVIVKFKKDCLKFLPQKRYEVIQTKPTPETLRAARTIRKRTTRAVTALMLLRELSDGFQYMDKVVGIDDCPNCEGKGTTEAPVPIDPTKHMGPQDVKPENFQFRLTQCALCDGSGEVDKKARHAEMLPCPKDDVFVDQLDVHEDVGRFIVWGGFKATIDRLVDISMRQGWHVLRVDGRGLHGFDPHGDDVDSDILLDAMDATHHQFDEYRRTYDKVCFIGQPGAGGTAYTLTASPTMLYYSNTFVGEDRIQSEDRHHRPGMDVNKGGLIIDIIHLPSDYIVLKNLKNKKRMQNMTMGQLEEAFNEHR